MNEVVFVADDDTVVKAEIDAASVLPYGSGETAETARKRAEAKKAGEIPTPAEFAMYYDL